MQHRNQNEKLKICTHIHYHIAPNRRTPLAVETESVHQLGEGVAAAVLRDLGAGDREQTATVLRRLCRLDALHRAELRLGRALALNEGVDAVDELAVVIELDCHVFCPLFCFDASYYSTNGIPAQLFS